MIAGSKPSVNEESIRYQARTKLAALAGQIAEARKLDSTSVRAKIRQATQIRLWLKALDYKEYLTREQREKIWYALIDIADINDFPTAPLLELRTTPSILIGVPSNVPGADGQDGQDGEDGATGLATDFLIPSASISTVVDSFDVTAAKAVRFDYYVKRSTGPFRAGSMVAAWNSDGSEIVLTPGLDTASFGDTSELEFTVQVSGTTIQFLAVITGGDWFINGTRYFIPNNGDGTGPINGVLPLGQIYIGNSLSQAQARTVSGDITITATGTAQIQSSVIINSHISPLAAIDFSKMAALTGDRIAITNSSGVIVVADTSTYPSLLELSRVKGVTSAIQTQLDAKMDDVFTTQGDIVYRGAAIETRLPIGSNGQILTVSGGIPSWQNAAAGFADPMTTIGDIIIRNGSNTTVRLPIGSAGQFLTVSGGIPAWGTGFTDPMTTIGDIIIRNGSNVTARLGIGAAGRVLGISGGIPAWTDIGMGSLISGGIVYTSGAGGPLANEVAFSYNPSLNTMTLYNSALSYYVALTGDEITVNQVSPAKVTRLSNTLLSADQAFGVTVTGFDLTLTGNGKNISIGTAGAVYPSDYSASYTSRSLVDKAYADLKIAASVMTTNGDIIIRSGGVPARLAVGSAGQVLQVGGGLPSWQTLTTASIGTTGGWGPFNFSNATNVVGTTDVAGTGSYSIVGDMVHVQGYVDVLTDGSGNVSFDWPLPVSGDTLYAGGGEGTLNGTGVSFGNNSWEIKYNGTDNNKFRVVANSISAIVISHRVHFNFMYRRLSV